METVVEKVLEQLKTFARLDAVQIMGAQVFNELKQTRPVDEVLITISTPGRSPEWFFARKPRDTIPDIVGTSVHYHIPEEDVTVCITTNSSVRDTAVFLFTFIYNIDLIDYQTLLDELRKRGFVR